MSKNMLKYTKVCSVLEPSWLFMSDRNEAATGADRNLDQQGGSLQNNVVDYVASTGCCFSRDALTQNRSLVLKRLLSSLGKQCLEDVNFPQHFWDYSSDFFNPQLASGSDGSPKLERLKFTSSAFHTGTKHLSQSCESPWLISGSRNASVLLNPFAF